MKTELHAITDSSGRPIQFFITAGQVSDYTGANVLMNDLSEAISVWTKFLHRPSKPKKRSCSGGGEHDRSYISAPRCVSGGEEARRVFANIAREEVSAVSGIFGSTREEVGGSETGV